MNETNLDHNPYSQEKRNDPRIWLVYGVVAFLLVVIGLGAVSNIHILRALPLVALAVGNQNVYYVGLEITHFPLCSPWAVGRALTMKCPPGTTYAARPYVRIWQGQISYYRNTQEIQAQSASLLLAQVLP